MGKRYSVGNKVSVLATHFDAQNTTTAEKWSFQTYVNEWRIARCEGEITRRDGASRVVKFGEEGEFPFKTEHLKLVERSHKNPGTSHSRRNKSGDARTGVNGSGDADLDEDSDAASDGANGDGGRSGPRRGNATDSSSDSDEDASPIKKRGRPKKAATAKKTAAAQDTTAEDAFLAESSSDDGAELSAPDAVCGRDCGGSTLGFVLMLFQNSYPSLTQFYPYTFSLQYADRQYFCSFYIRNLQVTPLPMLMFRVFLQSGMSGLGSPTRVSYTCREATKLGTFPKWFML